MTKILAACRYCDAEFRTWPDALDHGVAEHPRKIAARHPMTAIEPASARTKGRLPR